jgi:hypothetical protein
VPGLPAAQPAPRRRRRHFRIPGREKGEGEGEGEREREREGGRDVERGREGGREGGSGKREGVLEPSARGSELLAPNPTPSLPGVCPSPSCCNHAHTESKGEGGGLPFLISGRRRGGGQSRAPPRAPRPRPLADSTRTGPGRGFRGRLLRILRRIRAHVPHAGRLFKFSLFKIALSPSRIYPPNHPLRVSRSPSPLAIRSPSLTVSPLHPNSIRTSTPLPRPPQSLANFPSQYIISLLNLLLSLVYLLLSFLSFTPSWSYPPPIPSPFFHPAPPHPIRLSLISD